MHPDAPLDDLTRLVFDGRYEEHHADLVKLLHQETFQHRPDAGPRPGLTEERLALLGTYLGDSGARDPHRLFALHEWPGLVDTALTLPLAARHAIGAGGTVEGVRRGKLCVTSASLAMARAGLSLTVERAVRGTGVVSRTGTGRGTGAGTGAAGGVRGARELLASLARVYALTLLVNRVKNRYAAARARVVPAAGAARGASASPWPRRDPDPSDLSSLTRHLALPGLSGHSGPDGELDRLLVVTQSLGVRAAATTLAVCRAHVPAPGSPRVARLDEWTQAVRAADDDHGTDLVLAAQAMLSGRDYLPPVPAVRPRPEEYGLLDPAFATALLAHHERTLHATITTTSATRLSRGVPLQEIWSTLIDDALTMAEVHGTRLALESLTTAACGTRTPETHTALSLLAALFGLTEVARSAAWHLAEGSLTRAQHRALPSAVDDLCGRVAGYAPVLAEGFGIPASLVG
ncbi:acyl-CoA dehydrogenase [Streptomyces sp. NPDC057638]|uniref:acyl-CoA dehydrogenase n=1 Tax=Streptomyces sp. NPDC057638 TaxID=3346190 RepID=UPI0036C7BC96